eukprot:2089022-Rhodomonas_salina.1
MAAVVLNWRLYRSLSKHAAQQGAEGGHAWANIPAAAIAKAAQAFPDGVRSGWGAEHTAGLAGGGGGEGTGSVGG